MLFTAQYRYSGNDRIDITVKGQHPDWKVFAPTWDMVMEHKKGIINDQQYTDKYYKLLMDRYNHGGWAKSFESLASLAESQNVTVVCFCAKGAFCHRHLLCAFMAHNFATVIGGER